MIKIGAGVCPQLYNSQYCALSLEVIKAFMAAIAAVHKFVLGEERPARPGSRTGKCQFWVFRLLIELLQHI